MSANSNKVENTAVQGARLKLSEKLCQNLRCPRCGAMLERHCDSLKCIDVECGLSYPICEGVPILIDDETSLFSVSDFVRDRHTFFGKKSEITRLLKVLPSISMNLKARENLGRLAHMLLEKNEAPTVLVIGSGVLGQGMEVLQSNRLIEVINSDVSLDPHTVLILDAHSIPFADKTFDAVVVQAVLEHVADPWQCVDEIHRVLREDGLVYAETPFMQQVHGGRHDFTRFTHLGHRRLFRTFLELDSGLVCGPGMALAWAYQYFLLSFSTSRLLRRMIRVFARLTSFYLKYFDYYLIDKPGALDAASAFYFLGQKGTEALCDKDLVRCYRGTFHRVGPTSVGTDPARRSHG